MSKKIYYKFELMDRVNNALANEIRKIVYPDDAEAVSPDANHKMYMIEGMYRLVAGIEEAVQEED